MSLRYVILRRFCDSVLCNCTCSLRRPHPCLLFEHPTPHPWRKNQSPPSKTLPLGIGCSPHLWTKGGRKYFLIHVIISISIIMTHSHRVIRIFLWQIYIKKMHSIRGMEFIWEKCKWKYGILRLYHRWTYRRWKPIIRASPTGIQAAVFQ